MGQGDGREALGVWRARRGTGGGGWQPAGRAWHPAGRGWAAFTCKGEHAAPREGAAAKTSRRSTSRGGGVHPAREAAPQRPHAARPTQGRDQRHRNAHPPQRKGAQQNQKGAQHFQKGVQQNQKAVQHFQNGAQKNQKGVQHFQKGAQKNQKAVQHFQKGVQLRSAVGRQTLAYRRPDPGEHRPNPRLHAKIAGDAPTPPLAGRRSPPASPPPTRALSTGPDTGRSAPACWPCRGSAASGRSAG